MEGSVGLRGYSRSNNMETRRALYDQKLVQNKLHLKFNFEEEYGLRLEELLRARF